MSSRHFTHMRHHLRRTLSGLALLFAAGCGGGGDPSLLSIKGRVTVDGKPLDSGTITFLPSGEGPAVGGSIQGGSFSFGGAEGLKVGVHRVEIVSNQPTGKRITSPDDKTATIDEVRNTIPQRYNLKSQLNADVQSGKENAFEFDLASREDEPAARSTVHANGTSRGNYFD